MMKMEGWKDHLHFAFLGEHVLFPNLHIDSLAKFAVASFVAIFVCITERYTPSLIRVAFDFNMCLTFPGC